MVLVFPLGAAVSPEYAQRREKLRKEATDGVVVLFGAKESEDLHYGFFQESNFFYLSGWEEPGAILVLTPEPDKNDPALLEKARTPREILFLPRRVPSQEKWTGRKLGPSDENAASITGFTAVLPSSLKPDYIPCWNSTRASMRCQARLPRQWRNSRLCVRFWTPPRR